MFQAPVRFAALDSDNITFVHLLAEMFVFLESEFLFK